MVALEMAEYFGAEQLKTCVTSDSILKQKLSEKSLPALEMPGKKKSYLRRAIALRRIFKNNTVDVVLVQQLHDIWYLRMALLGMKQPKVIGLSHTFVGLSKKDPLHRWTYQMVDQLVCMTQIHKQNLLERLPVNEKQLKVIPNAVNTERFHPKNASTILRKSWISDPDDVLIGLVGRLDGGKGQDDLLQAAVILRDKNITNFRIVLVGEDTLNNQGTGQKLRQFVKENHLHKWVIFAGFRKDVPQVMASLDVLVMASHAETFGRVIIEGMASRVPVVATSAGGVSDIIDDQVNGMLVPSHDPEALAEALSDLILKPELRTQIAAAGFEKAQRVYSENVVLPQVFQVIEAS